MTEPETKQLPHGGTLEDYRRYAAKAGTEAAERQAALFDAKFGDEQKPSRADMENFNFLVQAGTNAWSVVALLRWIERKYGSDVALHAAAISQDIGMNGDPLDDTLLDVEPAPEPVGESA